MEQSRSTVDGLLEALTASLRGVLGDDLVGVYVYGSYVAGGFDSTVSDLDLAVVTAGDADQIDLVGPGRAHRDFITRNPEWKDRLEVVYIGRATLHAFRSSPGRLAVISPGEPFHIRDDAVAQWLQNWYLVRETGRALYGPPAAAVVPAITWAEFVEATARYAGEIADRSLGETAPGSLAYSLLTMCRAHMTVLSGTNGSKDDGAAWTRRRMPEWAWLVDAALRCRRSRGRIGFDDGATRAAARAMIALLAAEIERAPVVAP